MSGQVDEVKQRTDIVGVIGSRVELKNAGKYMKGLCPFHSEKSPSFFVSPEMQMYKCFGCGKSGDVFTFVQEYEGLSFREALEDLAEKVGVKLESYQRSDTEELTDRLRTILDLAKEYYHYLLTKHQVGQIGRDYLKDRGIDPGLVKSFYLGWAPDEWRGLLSYLVKKKGFHPDEVVQAGLAIESNKSGRKTYYDRFRGRVVFPLTDFRGRVVGFSGRVLDPDAKEAKYINSPETSLYHKRELLFGIDQARSIIRKKDKVIVVEGEFDVISSHGAGVPYIVAIKGSALTEEQVRLLLRLTKNITLCLDVDSAGEAATKRGIELADKLGAELSVLRVSGGKDPDDIARTTPKVWKEMVAKEAMSVYQFYIETAFANHDETTAKGKKHISQELLPILNKITNKVEQAYYVKEVASRLKTDERVIEQEMDRIQKSQQTGLSRSKQPAEDTSKKPTSQLDELERYVWSRLFRLEAGDFSLAWQMLESKPWQNPGLQRLSQLIQPTDHERFVMKTFVADLPEELKALVGELYLQEDLVAVTETQKIIKDISEVVTRLHKLQLKAEMKRLSTDIAELEDIDELTPEQQSQLETKQREFGEMMKKLR